jgi:hypothetical protein
MEIWLVCHGVDEPLPQAFIIFTSPFAFEISQV